MSDIRQLYSFIALADEMHFGRAAANVHIAQPALSQHIKLLEQRLGLRLFERDRRHVALTPEGRVLLEKARDTIGRYEGLLQAAASLRSGADGAIRLGYVGSAIYDPALMALMRDYRQARPGIELAMEEHDVNRQLTLLQSGDLDAALVRTPVPQLPGLVYRQVVQRALIAVLPKDHALSGAGTLSLRQLAQEPFLIQNDPPGVGLAWSVLAACRRAGFTPHPLKATRDVAVTIGLVALGMGVALVPETQALARREDISYHPLDDPQAVSTLTLAYRQNTQQAAVKDLARFVLARAVG